MKITVAGDWEYFYNPWQKVSVHFTYFLSELWSEVYQSYGKLKNSTKHPKPKITHFKEVKYIIIS